MVKKIKIKSSSHKVIFERINKLYEKNKALRNKKPVMLNDDDNIRQVVKHCLPSGIPQLDLKLAKGKNGTYGLPSGRICFLFGIEESGKTTLALNFCKQCLDLNGMVFFVETEARLDPKYINKQGIKKNHPNFRWIQPDTIEEAIKHIELVLGGVEESNTDTGKIPILIVWDSIAATPAVKESIDESDIDDNQMTLHARALTKLFRRISVPIANNQVYILFLNQAKEAIAIRSWVKQFTMIGGKSAKFHSSIIMLSQRGKGIKDKKDDIGFICRVRFTKNTLMKRSVVDNIPILYSKGVDHARAALYFLEEKKMLRRKGGRYEINGKRYTESQFVKSFGNDENFRKTIRKLISSSRKFIKKKKLVKK